MADLPRESTRLHTLLRIDDRPISDDRNEIRAFMTVRDEMLRLRQNLTHHRSIGWAGFPSSTTDPLTDPGNFCSPNRIAMYS
jgi:hypothetical protein